MFLGLLDPEAWIADPNPYLQKCHGSATLMLGNHDLAHRHGVYSGSALVPISGHRLTPLVLGTALIGCSGVAQLETRPNSCKAVPW
jgi:hypothetical protein